MILNSDLGGVQRTRRLFRDIDLLKDTCHGTNCNDQPISIAGDNKCYVCQSTMNSQGELVGFGDSYCFNDNLGESADSLAVDCGRDEYCLTDMRVNWTPQGDQEATITRRCSKEKCLKSGIYLASVLIYNAIMHDFMTHKV